METSKITGERIKEYLSQGKRFDNRKPEQFREIVVEEGVSKNAEGSARVKIGKTDVMVGIKMDVSEPYPDSPEKGNLVVNAELLPLSFSEFESGPPRFHSIELARVIDRGIRESKFIDFEKLCIKKGEKVWTVFIDIYTINHDGNLFDAAGFASLIALKNARIPKYDEKEEKVLYGEWTDKKIPLSKNIPFSITIYRIGNCLVIDPTKEEEEISNLRLTISISDGTVYSIQKGGTKELEVEEFYKILELAKRVEKEIFKKLEKNLK